MAQDDGVSVEEPIRDEHVETDTGRNDLEDSIRAAEDAALQKQLIALKSQKAAGNRPLNKPHERWLGDFLDQDGKTGLLPAEQKLLTASIRGEWCELRPDRPSTDADPNERIRGSFLRFLALGGDDNVSIHEAGIQLSGAIITGELNLQAAKHVLPLQLHHCKFTDTPNFSYAHLASLSFTGTWLPGLVAVSAEISSALQFNDGFEAEGEVRFQGVKIGGLLSCSGGKFRNRTDDGKGKAFDGDRAEIMGDVFFDDGFEVEGRVILSGAKLGGYLVCDGGKFCNHTEDGKGEAFSCENTEITDSVLLRGGFAAEGVTQLSGVQIGRDLVCSEGSFRNRNHIALSFNRAATTGYVFFSHGFEAEGEVRLQRTKIGGALSCVGGKFRNRTDDGEGKAFDGERVEIMGDVFLRDGFEAEGRVILSGAKLGGYLVCDGGKFRNRTEDGKGEAFSCDSAEIMGSVQLIDVFEAEGRVTFWQAKVGGHLNCMGGKFRNRITNGDNDALYAVGAEITGDVFLRDAFEAKGRVNLSEAKIGGYLVCTHGKFRNRTDNGEGTALYGYGAEIKGHVVLNGAFEAEGQVSLWQAKIGGNLNCWDGKFRNRTDDGKGNAIDGYDIEIMGNVLLHGAFEAQGEVWFAKAKISGDFVANEGTFNNAVLAPLDTQNDRRPQAATALNLNRANINGVLRTAPPDAPNTQYPKIHGSVDLQGAYAHQLIDHPEAWPGENGTPWITAKDGRRLLCTIALDGFTYDRIEGRTYDAKTRKAWLKRQPSAHRLKDFRLQPYEQLVSVLRRMGHDRDARAIAKARQGQERLARLSRSWPGMRVLISRPRFLLSLCWAGLVFLFEWIFFGCVAGYGYGKKRLIIMLIALWLAGAYVYMQAAEQGLMAPASPVVFTNKTLVAACKNNWTTCQALPKEHTAFDPYLYSADVMLPIIAFGVETDWDPIYAKTATAELPHGSILQLQIMNWSWQVPHWGLRFFYWLQIVIGWSLSALLVAVLSGIMKKE